MKMGAQDKFPFEQIDFDKGGGLIPAIAQDVVTGKVLMMAYMNEEALRATLETGRAIYWSRSRKVLWPKGDTSGNIQTVEKILVDCDQDTILLLVKQHGMGACHTGKFSCFYRKLTVTGEIEELDE
jgi:phosphoribosyl-AMP cyclohydrolase